MTHFIIRQPLALVLSCSLMLSACSYFEPLPPVRSAAPAPAVAAEAPAAPMPAAAYTPAPPQLNNSTFEPFPLNEGSPTGTYVGNKVIELRRDLARLQNAVGDRNRRLQDLRVRSVNNAQQYHALIAAVSARLQVGTTPGNPILVRQWSEAQDYLTRVGEDLSAMNSLANQVADDSAMTSYVLEATRATYSLSGAVDEDHRQLRILEDEVSRTVVLIDRLLTELSDDISRTSTYLSGERTNLNTLALAIKNGELFGMSLTNRAFMAASQQPLRSTFSPSLLPVSTSALPAPVADVVAARPLVVIRFDRDNVNFERTLYNAVSRALERRPEAAFEVVAVSPMRGDMARSTLNSNAANRYAQDVARSLADMGLPQSRILQGARRSETGDMPEVHVFVR